MSDERKFNQSQKNKALRTIENITFERNIKGNANVTAGRYGELVANLVRYAESEMALEMLEKENQNTTNTAPLYQKFDQQNLPGHQHLEPETLRGQNVINPT